MKRRIAVLVAVLAVLVASVTAAVAVSVTNGDGDRFGHRDAMMSPQWDSRTDRPRDREEPPHVQGPGGMMSGTGPMHGEQAGTEYAYLAKMVAHHQEAVAAARQLARSDSAEMRDFGESVVASQTAQIEKMQGWLANWYPDRSGQVAYQPMMRDLSGLEGDRLDQLFLQDMVRHHMGAVMMSQQLLIRGVADHQRVEVLARNIRDEQRVAGVETSVVKAQPVTRKVTQIAVCSNIDERGVRTCHQVMEEGLERVTRQRVQLRPDHGAHRQPLVEVHDTPLRLGGLAGTG